MLYNLKVILLLLAIINLIIASTVSYKFVNQFIVFIIISFIVLLSEISRIPKIKDQSIGKIISFLNVISKILFLVGFYILLTNVFVMKAGVQPCSTCNIASKSLIIAASVYLVFYLTFFWIAIADSYKKLII